MKEIFLLIYHTVELSTEKSKILSNCSENMGPKERHFSIQELTAQFPKHKLRIAYEILLINSMN